MKTNITSLIKKTAIVVVTLVASEQSIKAYGRNSELNLRMSDNSDFIVTLDNNRFNDRSSTFSLQNIQPGRHYLKIVKFPNQYNGGFCATPRVAFEGFIKVPASSVVYALIEKHRGYTVANVLPIATCSNNYNANYTYGNENYTYNTSQCGTSVYSSNNGGYSTTYTNCNASTTPVIMPMDNGTFMQLKSMMMNQSFESTQLITAKQALASNYLTSAQALDLMNVFTFESTKLDFAKYAYNRVVDKGNYFIVNNGFTFQSSVSALNSYIGF
ncbi:MAG: DUF4476 domain-containing protein [Bacteroidetes bacterium]|nr:DUF4476 domain-containing protein [Bacteroidota bacterium]